MLEYVVYVARKSGVYACVRLSPVLFGINDEIYTVLRYQMSTTIKILKRQFEGNSKKNVLSVIDSLKLCVSAPTCLITFKVNLIFPVTTQCELRDE